MITYRVFVFAEIKEPLHHPRRRPRHRPPSELEVRPTKSPCISCVAQIEYMVAQVAGHVQVTPPKGLCFAGVLINFRSGKFQALDISFFSKGHARFFREFWHDLC